MHPEDIKAAIRKRGTTMSALATSWGYSEAVIRKALKHPYPRVEQLVADFLGTTPKHIWPERYASKSKCASEVHKP